MTTEDRSKDPENCDHENQEYRDMDVGDPGVIYENWICRDCGSSIVKVLEPVHQLVYPPEADEPAEKQVIQ